METVAVSDTGRQTNVSIQWKQLWSLAALYGSIIIGWIACFPLPPFHWR